MEITLTEALAKLKLLDKKIQKKLYEIKLENIYLIDIQIGKSPKGKYTGLTSDEIAAQSQSYIDSLNQLIKNKNELKGKLAQANAVTTLSINGKEYTIVEAIERKRGLEQEKEFVSALKNELSNIQNEYQRENEKAKNTVEKLLESRLGSDAKNQSAEETQKLSEGLIELYQAKIIDPINLQAFIETKEEEINNFETEVDIQLSIVNANTKINVDFE